MPTRVHRRGPGRPASEPVVQGPKGCYRGCFGSLGHNEPSSNRATPDRRLRRAPVARPHCDFGPAHALVRGDRPGAPCDADRRLAAHASTVSPPSIAAHVCGSGTAATGTSPSRTAHTLFGNVTWMS